MTTLGNNLQSKLSTEALLALVKQKLRAWELQFCIQTGREPGKADAYANEKMGEHIIPAMLVFSFSCKMVEASSIGWAQTAICCPMLDCTSSSLLLALYLCNPDPGAAIIVLKTRVWYLVQRLCIASMHS
jgi:hypothetical protein